MRSVSSIIGAALATAALVGAPGPGLAQPAFQGNNLVYVTVAQP